MKNGTVVKKTLFPSPNPNVELYEIVYYSGGLRVKGLLAQPVSDGQYDGFLYLRGGIKGVGMVRPARIAQFAQQGFIVFAPYYRGNRGGEGNEDFAGDDREDAFSALQLLKKHERVKEGRVHVFGFSRGGVMALLTGIGTNGVTSIVTWGGVSDMFLTYEERKDLRRMMKRVIGGSPNKYPERYEWRTPLDSVEELDVPVLIIHGKKDENVSIHHAYRLEKRLKEAGKKVETYYFNEFTHYFPPLKNREIVQMLCEWMKKQV
ncbi:prolyl oligopeptidase family serine peptidase [Rossellomorea aquimaris]|uniref:alpha/beta hydrolase family protein n=1 Tax=Rossellomorea aquimaris TaxID=189382 RepID=UPI001CD24E0E|nr:prolyl oligopeptidase family serine peptidase [Rossellomorea aquimaris]MCA1056810.1 prolyl oligopeptidase family serine peptidase [Rossellomorea aquimaris]